MAKRPVTQFVCQECGNTEHKWQGRCPACGAWNSFIEETISAPTAAGLKKRRAVQGVGLSEIVKEAPVKRLKTNIAEVDTVLGGGIVSGSVMLLAGEPGIGKSTLILQVAAGVAAAGKVLYVSGEESLQQIKLRAERLGINVANIDLAAATSADEVAATVSGGEYILVIVDSIQTMSTDQLTASAGTVSQITASAQSLQVAAKASHSAVLMVGHVTKEGNIAGPKILEHLVDVVLYLEGERFGGFKLLRGVKNRFGSTHEVGIFEMLESGLKAVTNPSAAFLEERQPGDGSVVFATLEGSRALLIEVQALVSTSPFGYPKRTAVGFDLNRLNLLLAVLGKRAGINLGAQDVYVNVVGGMRAAEPAADLAVALAIASAYKSKAIKEGCVVLGEVGLSGEIRSVTQIDKRLAEAKKLGFKGALAPLSGSSSGFVVSVRSLTEAIKKGLE